MKTIENKYVSLHSPGGCGTILFWSWVGDLYKNRITPQTAVHHINLVSMGNDHNKVIYLYGDPVDCVLSFYRRHTKDSVFNTAHCRHLMIPAVTITLDEYIENGKRPISTRAFF